MKNELKSEKVTKEQVKMLLQAPNMQDDIAESVAEIFQLAGISHQNEYARTPDSNTWVPVNGEQVQGHDDNNNYIFGSYIEKSLMDGWYYIKCNQTGSLYRCEQLIKTPMVKVSINELIDEFAKSKGLVKELIKVVQES